MATIKMDVSEYEALNESKDLLKQSLEKERDYKKQIDKLNKEKIEALENAKMKVVKTITTKNDSIIYQRENDQISWNIICRYIGLFAPPMTNKIDKPLHFNVQELLDRLYVEKTYKKEPIIETTTHGLDDIKKELRDEIKNEIDDETKKILSNYDIIRQGNVDLGIENDKLHVKIVEYENKINQLEDKNASLMDAISIQNDKLVELNVIEGTYQKIKQLLTKKHKWYKKKRILSELNELIK